MIGWVSVLQTLIISETVQIVATEYNSYLHRIRVRGGVATSDGAPGAFPILGDFPDSLQAENSVPALDGRPPFDTPGDNVPALAIFF